MVASKRKRHASIPLRTGDVVRVMDAARSPFGVVLTADATTATVRTESGDIVRPLTALRRISLAGDDRGG